MNIKCKSIFCQLFYSYLFRNGEKYAGEIHFVYINPQTNQLAVLAIFMQSSGDVPLKEKLQSHRKKRRDIYHTENSILDEWERYFAIAGTVQYTNISVVLSLNLATLMGFNLTDFWRYSGSLTTPPCTEGIVWTVFKSPIIFTENQLNSFRKKLFVQDYREPQPLHNRTIYRSFVNEVTSPLSDYRCCSKVLENGANTFSITLLNLNILLFPLLKERIIQRLNTGANA